jgi:hypothetical protein
MPIVACIAGVVGALAMVVGLQVASAGTAELLVVASVGTVELGWE